MTSEQLKSLINTILTTLLDPALQEIEEATYIMRALNMVTVKIIERSEPTDILW